MNCPNITQSQFAVCCFENILEQHAITDNALSPFLLSSAVAVTAIVTCLIFKKIELQVKNKKTLVIKNSIEIKNSSAKTLFFSLFPIVSTLLSATNLGIVASGINIPNWLSIDFETCKQSSCTSLWNNQSFILDNQACTLTDAEAYCSLLWEKSNLLMDKDFTTNLIIRSVYLCINTTAIFASLLAVGAFIHHRKNILQVSSEGRTPIAIMSGVVALMSIGQLALSIFGATSNQWINTQWQNNINYCIDS